MKGDEEVVEEQRGVKPVPRPFPCHSTHDVIPRPQTPPSAVSGGLCHWAFSFTLVSPQRPSRAHRLRRHRFKIRSPDIRVFGISTTIQLLVPRHSRHNESATRTVPRVSVSVPPIRPLQTYLGDSTGVNTSAFSGGEMFSRSMNFRFTGM